jgi:hypothetical protein
VFIRGRKCVSEVMISIGGLGGEGERVVERRFRREARRVGEGEERCEGRHCRIERVRVCVGDRWGSFSSGEDSRRGSSSGGGLVGRGPSSEDVKGRLGWDGYDSVGPPGSGCGAAREESSAARSDIVNGCLTFLR